MLTLHGGGNGDNATGARVTVLVGGEVSDGRCAVVETIAARGAAPPRHRHSREDETLYVVAGALRVWFDGAWIAATPGTTVFLPRGSEHAFVVETETAHLLSIFAPAGFEGCGRELGNGREPPSLERLIATAARYGCDITGPPPG